MVIEQTPFKQLLVLKPDIFTDERGSFVESFNEAKFRIETGMNLTFVQDNESVSKKNVLRGLHFQVPPKSQAKLVRVARGAVLDVVVDLRITEPTYGQSFQIVLSEENKSQLFIPEGFAHGFLVLEDQTIFSYKCSNYYSKDYDRSMLWCDEQLNINWGVANPIVSEKDKNAQRLADFESPFF
jgi:dTDP-4-dehydrorhamnose 3,5-epimerase